MITPFVFLVAFATPLCLTWMLLRWTAHIWGGWLARCPPWRRVLAVVAFSAVVLYGGSKTVPLPLKIRELLVVMADGSLKDLSGKIAPGVQARAVAAYIADAQELADAADVVLEDARADCAALTNQLHQMDLSVAYIALDLPRGTPAELNHNIMVSFERVEQTASNLTAYVWFSELPATNVNIHVEYSLRPEEWTELAALSNSFPGTFDVGGVQCFKYVYAIPAGIAGTPLRPQYEIEFGGYGVGQWLSVPESGVVVEAAGVEHVPFTGWDEYLEGEDSLSVRYVGGIAVSAIFNGVEYKGGIEG